MITIDAPSSPEDWRRLRELCCDTAYGGQGLDDPSRREFFGRYWVGPYERLEPAWALAARAPDGAIVGYLTGCPDTAAFETRRRTLFYLPLLARVLAGAFPRTQDTRTFVRRCLKLERDPAEGFSADTKRRLKEEFPAHLHVNFTAAARGQGLGRRLVDAFAGMLKKRGVRGFHVCCGRGPLGFYQKLGMELLEALPLPGGSEIYMLGLKVS